MQAPRPPGSRSLEKAPAGKSHPPVPVPRRRDAAGESHRRNLHSCGFIRQRFRRSPDNTLGRRVLLLYCKAITTRRNNAHDPKQSTSPSSKGTSRGGWERKTPEILRLGLHSRLCFFGRTPGSGGVCLPLDPSARPSPATEPALLAWLFFRQMGFPSQTQPVPAGGAPRRRPAVGM